MLKNSGVLKFHQFQKIESQILNFLIFVQIFFKVKHKYFKKKNNHLRVVIQNLFEKIKAIYPDFFLKIEKNVIQNFYPEFVVHFFF